MQRTYRNSGGYFHNRLTVSAQNLLKLLVFIDPLTTKPITCSIISWMALKITYVVSQIPVIITISIIGC